MFLLASTTYDERQQYPYQWVEEHNQNVAVNSGVTAEEEQECNDDAHDALDSIKQYVISPLDFLYEQIKHAEDGCQQQQNVHGLRGGEWEMEEVRQWHFGPNDILFLHQWPSSCRCCAECPVQSVWSELLQIVIHRLVGFGA